MRAWVQILTMLIFIRSRLWLRPSRSLFIRESRAGILPNCQNFHPHSPMAFSKISPISIRIWQREYRELSGVLMPEHPCDMYDIIYRQIKMVDGHSLRSRFLRSIQQSRIWVRRLLSFEFINFIWAHKKAYKWLKNKGEIYMRATVNFCADKLI